MILAITALKTADAELFKTRRLVTFPQTLVIITEEDCRYLSGIRCALKDNDRCLSKG